MLGPFPANENDAQIMRHIIDDPNGLLSQLMKPGDIFILDRGFRDVKGYLESKQFTVLMPALKGKRKQLTTQESNDSRFVTKLRWVVESVHGMIKQKNALLDNDFDNKMIPKIGPYYRIAAFLHNQFSKRLISDVNITDDILQRMIDRKNTENTLAEEVETKGWFRKKLPFEDISEADILDFPELTENQLKILFSGTYQFSQAISYLAEVIDEDGHLNLKFVKEKSNILKIQVQSRHMNRKIYRCFIESAGKPAAHLMGGRDCRPPKSRGRAVTKTTTAPQSPTRQVSQPSGLLRHLYVLLNWMLVSMRLKTIQINSSSNEYLKAQNFKRALDTI
ncbi:unnamed protein product [Euphydryas editha]|uniref:DDE Tnp4 domain-containing protein n=1 Tax=Euphydryas editha TaxID=104508 RepID=A0AAU9TT70_EUPED|nr:unnamed protein product [Euphydryas editha]